MQISLGLFSLVGAVLLAPCTRGARIGDELTRADFDFLQLGMSYAPVVAQVGEADRDVGSGVSLMVYGLSDGTEIILAFPSPDNLTAVYLYDPETDTRETILGP
jgi:hypothetical protein